MNKFKKEFLKIYNSGKVDLVRFHEELELEQQELYPKETKGFNDKQRLDFLMNEVLTNKVEWEFAIESLKNDLK